MKINSLLVSQCMFYIVALSETSLKKNNNNLFITHFTKQRLSGVKYKRKTAKVIQKKQI